MTDLGSILALAKTCILLRSPQTILTACLSERGRGSPGRPMATCSMYSLPSYENRTKLLPRKIWNGNFCPTFGSQLLSCSMLVQLFTNWLKNVKHLTKSVSCIIIMGEELKFWFSLPVTWKMLLNPLSHIPAPPCLASESSTSTPPPIYPTSLSCAEKFTWHFSKWSPSHGGFKWECKVVLVDTLLPSCHLLHHLPVFSRALAVITAQQTTPQPLDLRSVEWKWQQDWALKWQWQLTWHWCWVEAPRL